MIVRKVERPYDLVPAGDYVADVVCIREKQMANDQTGYLAIFRIAGGPHDGKTVTAVSGPYHHGSALERWFKAAGIDVEIGQDVDTEALVGQTFRVKVILTKRGDREYSNVSELTACDGGVGTEDPGDE